MRTVRYAKAWALALGACLAACGGGGSAPSAAPTEAPTGRYALQGRVSGITASTSVELLLNGKAALTLTADGDFKLPESLPSGSSYTITLGAPQGASTHVCTVSNGSGLISSRDVSDISISCSAQLVRLGGEVRGLFGKGLVLQSGAGDQVPINGDGRFEFKQALSVGTIYKVAVLSSPTSPSQTCTVNQGAGITTKEGSQDLVVICSTNSYKLGGVVSGLVGRGLELENNGASPLLIAADGPFLVPAPVASGARYQVSVRRQPTAPNQTCSVNEGSGDGSMDNADIHSVRVICATNTYRIGGMVEGLLGQRLVLQNNGSDDLSLGSNGAFSFSTPIASGAGYAISVRTQPSKPRQTCTVNGGAGAGTVGDHDIGTVSVVCATESYRLGGVVSGLRGTLVLQNNGSDDLLVKGNGQVTFRGPVASGAGYAVSIKRQPENERLTCTVSGDGAHGDILDADKLSAFRVVCSERAPRLGGVVTGLQGHGLVLESAGHDTLQALGSGEFWFDRPIGDGASYSVSIKSQPVRPAQYCRVSSGSGTVIGADVKSVQVACSTMSDTYLAVTSATHDQLVVFNVDTISGELRHVANAGTGRYPRSVVVSPDRRYIHVGNFYSGDIYTYAFDAAANSLRWLATTPVNSLRQPYTMAMTPDGRYLYVGGWRSTDIAKFSIASGTGIPTEFDRVTPSDSPSSVTAIAIDSTGRYAYASIGSGVSPHAINPTTGELAPIAGGASYLSLSGLIALVPGGDLLFTDSRDGLVGMRLNRADGTVISAIAQSGLYQNFTQGAALSPSGRYLAYAPHKTWERFLFLTQVDSTSGQLRSTAPPQLLQGELEAIAIDPQDKFVFAGGLRADLLYTYALLQDNTDLRLLNSVPFNGPSAMQVFEYSRTLGANAARRRLKAK